MQAHIRCSVVGGGHCLVPFLCRSVPHAQHDPLPINFDHLGHEADSLREIEQEC